MKLVAFRIQHFRSIVDTKWCKLSTDHVTILVGQNESGKTSILDALHCLVGDVYITEDDLRTSSPLPTFYARCEFESSDYEDELPQWCPEQQAVVNAYLKRRDKLIDLKMTWAKTAGTNVAYDFSVTIDDPQLDQELAAAWQSHLEANPDVGMPAEGGAPTAPVAAPQPAVQPGTTTESAAQAKNVQLTAELLGELVHRALPTSTLFNADGGLLPNTVDINEKKQLSGQNSSAAANFLTIAGLKLSTLLSVDRRERTSLLQKANDSVSRDFNLFWTQKIGKGNRLSIRCDMENYGEDVPEKVGKPHLVFWIGDGNTRLYPKQRSTGVRWFVSFYLQLKASEKQGGPRIFLMDEPGANLHPKAQKDVLSLINQLSDEIVIIFSTHSTPLLEYIKFYRIHAVQRDGDQEDSPTVVIDAHRLGSASTDTLTPILMAMGTDVSSQDVVKHKYNVLLEEISGFYYMNSFWKLTGCQQEAHFLAATGASNIPLLANMFLGWGLMYSVVVDDEGRGRAVYNQLKRDLFGDDAALANRAMWKIRGCAGIEDVFSKIDFQNYVLRDSAAIVSGKNTSYLASNHRSKPVMAYMFWMDVQSGAITLGQLDAMTVVKIKEIVSEVSQRLANQATAA